MIIQAVVMLAYFLNNLWIVGVFRAGGDNMYTMKLIIVTTWLISLPLVLAGAYLFHGGEMGLHHVCAGGSQGVLRLFPYRPNRWANILCKECGLYQ